MAKVTLINPPMLALRQDPMTAGIVYMPVGLAVSAAGLRNAGHQVSLIDAFGSAPGETCLAGKFLRRGLASADCAARVPEDTDAVAVYALNLLNHDATLAVLRAVRRRFPNRPLAVIENSQAVTAYSLAEVASTFYDAGADTLLLGESDDSLPRWLDTPWKDEPTRPGFLSLEQADSPVDLSSVSFPAWDLFPLRSYWLLGHAHGPLSSSRYLAVQTSRGCPYHCRFCVTPALNHGRWRPRPAESVVEEMRWAQRRFNVHEFHWEDLNPTVDDQRTKAICEAILRNGMPLPTWKIVSGTKVESLKDEETIRLMARSGCTYMSISPETGSPRVLKLMGKPFDLDHAIRIARAAKKEGIFLQCCFVLGFPGETDNDRRMTEELVATLTKLGVDEIALFIMTPAPGAAEFDAVVDNISLSELNFSPTWRDDYRRLSQFRSKLYRSFVLQKTVEHPVRVMRQAFNFVRRRFETKMEMAPYRALCHKALILRSRQGVI